MARILIVEDEGILALTTRLELENMGHEVIGIADNGIDAIEMARSGKPRFVLMDIVLKGTLNGIEASGAICEENVCDIIYMTAHADAATVNAARDTRHIGFLLKPFDTYQLKAVIDDALIG